MERVKVAGSEFVLAESGERFLAWGFNYDHDAKMRLIEEYWYDEWPTVERHFGEMAALGANVVRMHPQFTHFMESPTRANGRALDQWRRLLELAERTGLYIDATGLGCYRRAEAPAWFNALAESDRWDAQAAFWGALAECSAGSKALFFYDLLNEPHIPGEPAAPGHWLCGDLAGFAYGHMLTLDRAGREPHEVAREWVGRMRAAIRAKDPEGLITVGLDHHPAVTLAGFAPEHMADLLDFFCLHCYPDTKQGPEHPFSLKRELEEVQRFSQVHPVIIEEIYPLGCSVEALRGFLKDAAPSIRGGIGFYWGNAEDHAGMPFLPKI
jgi:hypothetical protein